MSLPSGDVVVEDEGLRRALDPEKLRRLRPAFAKVWNCPAGWKKFLSGPSSHLTQTMLCLL